MSATFEIKENTILVLLGASGDLAKKKLVTVNHWMPILNAKNFHLVSSPLWPRKIAPVTPKNSNLICF